MSTWLVVPVKSLTGGKSRLAPALNSAQRQELMDQLLAHVLKQGTQFPGNERVVVVSGCNTALRRAREIGVNTIEETGNGLNAALEQAQTELRGMQATRMLIVPLDLPLLHTDDLLHLAQHAAGNTLAIAPDRMGRGTNAMNLSTSIEFPFEFGAESFSRHVESARRLGLEPVVIKRPGLAFDVDTPEDLTYLFGHRRFHPTTDHALVE